MTELREEMRGLSGRGAVIFFLICAAVDFVFGYWKQHSPTAGVVSIFAGFPLSLLLFFVLRATTHRHGSE